MRKMIILTTLIFLISINTNGQESNLPDSIKSKLEQGEEIFMIVEKKPEYPGGFAKFYKYISKNLKYPRTAKRNGVSGKVYVQFSVNSNGELVEQMKANTQQLADIKKVLIDQPEHSSETASIVSDVLLLRDSTTKGGITTQRTFRVE